MSAARFAWVLNLDANEELAGRPDNPQSALVRARVAERVAGLELLVAGGVVLGTGRDAAARGLFGRAFCPTARALRAMERAGVQLPRAPPMAVLARANHRGFCAGLGQGLAHGAFVTTLPALAAALAERPDLEWVMKHPFGYVGRMRLRTRVLDARATDFAQRCIREAGGVQVEPWVERAGDFALHGFVDEAGRATLGDPTCQVCDARGAWQETTRAHDLDTSEARALLDEGTRVADALAGIGYFGPFGVDGFRYLSPGRKLNPRCEINARYTMGWAIGMGGRRPDQA